MVGASVKRNADPQLGELLTCYVFDGDLANCFCLEVTSGEREVGLVIALTV